MSEKAFMSWSGGKDSALALYRILSGRARNPSLRVVKLLTNINAAFDRVSMHGVRRELVEMQARNMDLPLDFLELPEQPSMDVFRDTLDSKLRELKAQQITHGVFGDIFLEDLKRYREQQLAAQELLCAFPLWGDDPRNLLEEFFAAGFRAVVVCVNNKWLDASFCGREFDRDFVRDLPEGIDPCGENGEFHSFVYDGPVFSSPVHFCEGAIVQRSYAAPGGETCAPNGQYDFSFCDLLPSFA